MPGSTQSTLNRLLIVSGDFPPAKSGEAGHAFHLARALAERGLEVHVLTSAIDGVIRHPSLVVHPIMRGWSWSALPRFAKFLNSCAPDAILLIFLGGMYESHPMMTFAPTVSRFFLPRVPFITQFEHTYITSENNSLLTRLVRKCLAILLNSNTVSYSYGTLLRDSYHIIALNEVHQKRLAEIYPEVSVKSALIPPPPLTRICSNQDGAARLRGRTLLGMNDDDFLLIYYGYIYPGKGIETLLRAFALVCGQPSRLRLVLAGDVGEHVFSDKVTRAGTHYARALQELSEQLSISDRIIWTGPCPPESEEGSLYMWAADACVLPFDKGVHLNNSTFSAAATHGLPIITTRGEFVESPFVQGENVWLCPPKDPEALAAGIQFIMENPDVRHRLRAGALTLANKWFSWDGAVHQTLALFER